MRRLYGTRDLLDGEWTRLNSLVTSLRDYLSGQGYRPVDTPLLEPTDLFLKKSGGELASRLYAFTDPGGHRVSLRPEFTASIIRAYIQAGLPPPVRWQYAGPVFRYQEAADGPLRQFTQVGAELIGIGSPQADAEVVGLACQGLAGRGLPIRLRLGHVGLLSRLLAGFGLSERTRWFLASRVAGLRAGDGARLREEMARLGLYPDASEPLAALASAGEARPVVERLLAGMGGLPGRREPEEIISRFLDKLGAAEEPQRVDRALSFLEELAQIREGPQTAFDRLERLVGRYKLQPGPHQEQLEALRKVVDGLDSGRLGGAQLELDLGLARGLAYYTGMVFELSTADGRPLGGGGRYDGLVKALGGAEDTPALGFAYTLEAVDEALSAGGWGG